MGWKASMLIIQNPANFRDDEAILQAIGMNEYKYSEDTVLEECMYPCDESINIGYYNNCIIICDDFQLSGKFIMDEVSPEEVALAKLFPNSEILTVSCLSTTNFHGYSLIKNGKQVRAKAISADDGFYVNIGEPIEQEQAIYEQSTQKQGERYWVLNDMPDDEFTEDQMMEDFTFGIAKRLLGVRIDEEQGDELMFETTFKKYVRL